MLKQLLSIIVLSVVMVTSLMAAYVYTENRIRFHAQIKEAYKLAEATEAAAKSIKNIWDQANSRVTPGGPITCMPWPCTPDTLFTQVILPMVPGGSLCFENADSVNPYCFTLAFDSNLKNINTPLKDHTRLEKFLAKLDDFFDAKSEDRDWYQTVFAKKSGSSAAPTASLHFKEKDLEFLKQKGVKVVSLTLHVGLGTYLPVEAQDLNDHKMHFEEVSVPKETWVAIQEAKASGFSVWALGTTVTRSLESLALGMFKENESAFEGETNLLIQEGFDFKVVDRLLTNFHQPESTLLALVAGFTSLENVLSSYDWAIKRDFKLFSYGDLSVWVKPQK
jgi:hypothetical protein